MTSSNGADHFPPIPTDPNESVWIQVKLPNFLIEKVDELAKADFSNRSAAVAKCVANYGQSHSQQAPSLSCDGVSVREEGKSVTTDNLPLQFFPHQQSATITAVESDSPEIDSPTTPKGESVGKSEGKRKGTAKLKKELAPCLEDFQKEILGFWEVKQGGKSQKSWDILMRELSKLHAHLNVGRSDQGRETFLQQIELATADRFKNIMFANYQAYGAGKQGKAQPEEPKHPASQVFKASDMNWPSVGEIL